MKGISNISSTLPRSGIREIMDLSANYADVIHLEVGEPSVDTPVNIKNAAIDAINSGYTHYTPNAGLKSLRRSITKYMANSYQLTISPDQVIVAPGAVTAIKASLLSLVEADDEVLIPDPGWPNYEQMVLSQGAVPVRYKLDENQGFKPDTIQLEKVISDKTKAIIINSPANPTGSVLSEQEVEKILALASKHDIYVISDEVYDGIIFEGKHICPFIYDNNRVISVFSFSKNYAMTGWRVGYAIPPSHIAPTVAKLIEPMVSCASSISQMAAQEAINGPQGFIDEMREVYKKRRNKTIELFERNGVKVHKSNGSFYMLVDIAQSGLSSHDFAVSLLKEERVAVAPGITFGPSNDNLIRISLATEKSQLIEGVERICKFIEKHKKEKPLLNG